MARSKVFMSNRSQAVRLPKAVSLPDGVKDVEVFVVGNARLIVPADAAWDVFFDGPAASADFMTDREQPEPPEREPF